MSESSDPEVPDTTAPKKRKRSTLPAEGEELEIDVNLPEPPSKKALRRQKKGKPATSATPADTNLDAAFEETSTVTPAAPTSGVNAEEKRSGHGIWIGNLAFSIDKTALRTFLTAPESGLTDSNITRVHMPAPPGGADASRRLKPQNKGFAYVDFDTAEAVKSAIALSEGMLMGRRVLIKDATSFAGRPVGEKSATRAALGLEDKNAKKGEDGGEIKAPERSKRIFVGNLGFDVTKEELDEHFGQAGEVEDVFLATFQDTGKCKGFGWIRFVDEDAAEAAVKGFVFKDMEGSGSEDEGEEEEAKEEDGEEGEGKKKKKAKKQKKRKWFINRLNGRTMRCEYAEDSKTRYTKRFGKGAPGRDRQQNGEGAGSTEDGAPIQEVGDGEAPRRQRMRGDKDQRQEQRRMKHVDARKIRPGAALANAPRASGAIAESQGKKITFDE